MKRLIKFLIVIFIFGFAFFSFIKKPNNELNADINRVITIKGHNLSLESSINIVYYVITENIDSYTECGVLVWDEPQNSYTIDDDYDFLVVKDGTETINDVDYDTYYFDKVAAKQFTDYFYAVAYYKVDSNYYYSEVDRYSLLDYCYNKKGSDKYLKSDSLITLGETVTTLLEYGASAQKTFNYHTDRLANATYYKVTLVGAKFSDGFSTMLFPEGTNITVTAKETTYIGFVNWTNDTTEMSTSKAYEFTVNADITLTANFESIAAEGLAYELKSDNTYKITGIGTFSGSNLLILDTYNGKPVTEIGEQAFMSNSTINSVYIPEGVTTIGNAAFAHCSNLKEISLPNTLTYVGRLVFSSINSKAYTSYDGCYYLGNKTNKYLLLIGFYENKKVFNINSDCKIIGGAAFEDAKNMSSITIPEGVVSIGKDAFYGLTNLVSITLPKSLTIIGEQVFRKCTGLTSITFNGTKAQWASISKRYWWNYEAGNFTVHCSDD